MKIPANLNYSFASLFATTQSLDYTSFALYFHSFVASQNWEAMKLSSHIFCSVCLQWEKEERKVAVKSESMC